MHLYIHVPFCARRCSYCDFAIAVRREVPVREYIGALRAEMDVRGLGGDALATVYLGGGTPSKLGGDGITALLALVGERFAIDAGAEITIECNPEDVTPEAASAWRGAGVNRLSLGVQSFDAGVLEWMHRTHDPGAAARAMLAARGAGINNISLDLIFAVPDSLGRVWADDVARALELSPSHVSAYGLTVEAGTPLGRWSARGAVHAADEERWEAEFLFAHGRLTAAGFEHYEVSNYARPGMQARHNASYWSGAAYLGVGPSAHGFDGATRRWNRREYVAWRDAALGGGDPVEGSETLTAGQRLAEAVYLGLRSVRGLAMEPADTAVVGPWEAAGWAEVRERHGSRIVVLSAAGWQRLDALAAALTDVRSRC